MTTTSTWRRRGAAPILAICLVAAACSSDDDAALTITSDAEGVVDVDGEPVDRSEAADDTEAPPADDGEGDEPPAADGDMLMVDGEQLEVDAVTCEPAGPPGAGDIEVVSDDRTLLVNLAGATAGSYTVRWTPGVFGATTTQSFALDFNDDRDAVSAAVARFDIEDGTAGSVQLPPSSDDAVTERPDGLAVQWDVRCP